MRPAGIEQVLRFFFRVQGRIGQMEYGLGVGFIYAIYFAILTFVFTHDLSPDTALFLLFLTVPLLVALAVLMAKRCHDIGLPGSFFLLFLVPLAGFVWLIALGFLPGNPGDNAYGPPPEFLPE